MKHPIPSKLLALAPALLALGTGCVSIPLGAERVLQTRTDEKKVETVSVEVESFRPVVQRSGSSATVRLELDGSFTDRMTERTSRLVAARTKLSFGLFPGLANANPSENLVGGSLLALWYNVLFLGAPTVNGLLLEPLEPASAKTPDFGGTGSFSRAALVGFHKFEEPQGWVRGVERATLETKKETRPVRGVGLDFRSDAPFWTGKSCSDGTLVLNGLPQDARTGVLEIRDIPADHPYREPLLGLRRAVIEVTIPAP